MPATAALKVFLVSLVFFVSIAFYLPIGNDAKYVQVITAFTKKRLT